jgi:hypothetical protein
MSRVFFSIVTSLWVGVVGDGSRELQQPGEGLPGALLVVGPSMTAGSSLSWFKDKKLSFQSGRIESDFSR